MSQTSRKDLTLISKSCFIGWPCLFSHWNFSASEEIALIAADKQGLFYPNGTGEILAF